MTYFSRLSPWSARLILAIVVVLVGLGALVHPTPHLAHLAPPGAGDEQLYRGIVDRISHGQDYYHAAAAEHRARSYPTYPPQVFRQPLLATILAAIPSDGLRRLALLALSVVAFFALRSALVCSGINTRLRIFALFCIGTGFGIAWFPGAQYIHEVWAALLIALSLAWYRQGWWIRAVLLGFCACLFRELALPYLAAMAAFALWERKYAELASWVAAMLIFSGIYAWHLSIARTLPQHGDLISAGWLYYGGWGFALETAKRNYALIEAPYFIVAFAVCASLLGLLSHPDRWFSRMALIVGGYLTAFLFVGRPDTSYWGMLFSPLLPIGVALSPPALRDLIERAWAGHPAPAALVALRSGWRRRRGQLRNAVRNNPVYRRSIERLVALDQRLSGVPANSGNGHDAVSE